MESVQIDAIGVAFIGTITEDGAVVNVSSVSTKELIFRRPDGTTVTKTASFTTNGTDGKIQFVSDAGFLNASGPWKFQANVVFPAGFNGKSDIQPFEVVDNL